MLAELHARGEAVDFALVDGLPDFVPGYRVRDDATLSDEIRGRAFNGLGLLVLDPEFRPQANGHEALIPFAQLRP